MQIQSPNFVNPEKIPKILECIFCADFFRDPVRLICGHVFCKSCIDQWFEQKHDIVCPVDRKTFYPIRGMQYQPDFLVQNILSEFEVYCPKKDQNCLQVLKLKNLEQHLQNCFPTGKRLSQDDLNMFWYDQSVFQNEQEKNKFIQNQQLLHDILTNDKPQVKKSKKNKFLETLINQKDFETEALINKLLDEDLQEQEENDQLQSSIFANKKNKKSRKQKPKQRGKKICLASEDIYYLSDQVHMQQNCSILKTLYKSHRNQPRINDFYQNQLDKDDLESYHDRVYFQQAIQTYYPHGMQRQYFLSDAEIEESMQFHEKLFGKSYIENQHYYPNQQDLFSYIPFSQENNLNFPGQRITERFFQTCHLHEAKINKNQAKKNNKKSKTKAKKNKSVSKKKVLKIKSTSKKSFQKKKNSTQRSKTQNQKNQKAKRKKTQKKPKKQKK